MDTFFGQLKATDEDFVLATDFKTVIVTPRARAENAQLTLLSGLIPSDAFQEATRAPFKTVRWTGQFQLIDQMKRQLSWGVEFDLAEEGRWVSATILSI